MNAPSDSLPGAQATPPPKLDPAAETPAPAIRKTPLDVKVLAAVARMTGSVSPMSVMLALFDWAGHLAWAPGKRLDLLLQALESAQALTQSSLGALASQDEAPPAPDRRFADPAWQQWPFNLWSRASSAPAAC